MADLLIEPLEARTRDDHPGAMTLNTLRLYFPLNVQLQKTTIKYSYPHYIYHFSKQFGEKYDFY